MDGAEEKKMLKEIAQAEKLSHPTENDENIIEENSRSIEEPPPLCAVSRSLVAVKRPPSSSKSRLNLNQILHHVIKYLNLRDLLGCRAVCQEVCEFVDQQLQNNLEISPQSTCKSSLKFPQNSVFINCRIHSSPNGKHIFEGVHLLDTSAIQAFLEKMRGQKRNPFVGRCVRFGHYDGTSNCSGYWENVLDLLREFGNHIWHVELSDGHMTFQDHVACYRLLRHCISLLPNLKSLELSFALPDISGDGEQVAAVNRYMIANPMPQLQFLQKLEWTDHHRVSQVFQDSTMAEYSEQLKAFSSPVSPSWVETSKLKFPNLEILYLTNVSNSEQLSHLRAWTLPSLKKLYLNLGGERCTSCGDFSDEIWSMKSLLLLVKQFRLEFLSLFLAPGCQLKGIRTLSAEEWKLDCLKSLEIHHNKETSYEFLKCFPKLEHLHFFDIHHPVFPDSEFKVEEKSEIKQSSNSGVVNNGDDGTLEEQVVEIPTYNTCAVQIDKFLYTGKMYESNLWEILPSLQVVTFKCVWDRQGKIIIDVNKWYWRKIYQLTKERRLQ